MIYSTKEAAEYLKLSISAVKYHVYLAHLAPQKVGHSLVFTKVQLDKFETTRRGPGRPKKDK